MMSPPNPREKPLSLGVAWELGSPLLTMQPPRALLELRLSIPAPLEESQAVPKLMFTSRAACACARAGRRRRGSKPNIFFIDIILRRSYRGSRFVIEPWYLSRHCVEQK